MRSRFQGLVLNVVLSGISIEFEPSYTGVEVVVLNAFDKILDAVSSIPRVETKLYPSDSKAAAKGKLKPAIADEILEGAKAQVRWWWWWLVCVGGKVGMRVGLFWGGAVYGFGLINANECEIHISVQISNYQFLCIFVFKLTHDH